jgi:hypothetical protein
MVNESEFLDQRQIHGHAFHLLEEDMLFLRRRLPVAGRIGICFIALFMKRPDLLT